MSEMITEPYLGLCGGVFFFYTRQQGQTFECVLAQVKSFNGDGSINHTESMGI